MSWSSPNKNEAIFCTLCFISMYSVLYILSEYTYFYILKKHYLIHFCCLFLKSLKAFSASLKSDFVYLIFFWCFIVPRFFLTIKTTKNSILKHWNQFCEEALFLWNKVSRFYSITIIHCWSNYKTCLLFTLAISRSMG